MNGAAPAGAPPAGPETSAPAARSPLVVGEDGLSRCGWIGMDLEYRRYHDEEWGVPQHEPNRLFEKLCLEGFQAGLSWITILRRRPAFREVFHGFDPVAVAAMGEAEVLHLLDDARIIRHRGKIEATISNARAMLTLDVPLDTLLWSFAPSRRGRRPSAWGEIPAQTAESKAMSAELRRRGFRFVGPTTMYALMQSTGMVDDHLEGCFRAGELG